MSNTLRIVLLCILPPAAALASPDYGRKTGKECNYCHPPNNFNLTDAGKYYQQHKSLKGYVPAAKPDASGRSTGAAPSSQKQSSRN